jgi:hypothetical protein
MTRGRVLLAAGSIVALIGMALPWVTVGGASLDLPVYTRNGFTGAGILIFAGAVASLVVLLLPYAASSGRSALDKPVVYALLAGLMVVGLAVQVVHLWTGGTLSLWPPEQCPGLWLSIIGVILAVWGVAELQSERPGRRQGPTLRTRR